MRVAILAIVAAIVIGLALPASADERPTDPFGNDTIEIDKDSPLARLWESVRHKMHLEKDYFYECLHSKDDPCPLIPALEQKLNELRQYQGKALLGHLNISINLMIKYAPADWVGPLEGITMRRGNCKSYSLAKYAAAQEVGISADHLRLVIVHHRARGEDHMVVAVYHDGEWFILDNLTNILARDREKPDYEPLAILDYKGARRYISAFWMQ
jgi:predicted transglutaminase-like cysteine proteinase